MARVNTLATARRCLRTYLAVPAISEEEELSTVEEDVKNEPSRVEEFTLEPAFAHGC